MNDYPTNVKEKLNSIISDMANHPWLFSEFASTFPTVTNTFKDYCIFRNILMTACNADNESDQDCSQDIGY